MQQRYVNRARASVPSDEEALSLDPPPPPPPPPLSHTCPMETRVLFPVVQQRSGGLPAAWKMGSSHHPRARLGVKNRRLLLGKAPTALRPLRLRGPQPLRFRWFTSLTFKTQNIFAAISTSQNSAPLRASMRTICKRVSDFCKDSWGTIHMHLVFQAGNG